MQNPAGVASGHVHLISVAGYHQDGQCEHPGSSGWVGNVGKGIKKGAPRPDTHGPLIHQWVSLELMDLHFPYAKVMHRWLFDGGTCPTALEVEHAVVGMPAASTGAHTGSCSGLSVPHP